MDQEPERKENLSPDEEEDYGGPIKSFLEHLEDLRWMLIRVVVAVILGMLVCLISAKHVVGILTWPLDRANLLMVEYFEEQSIGEGGGTLHLELGTNVWRVALSSNEFSKFAGGTNSSVAYRLAPVVSGTNLALGLQPVESPKHPLPLNPKGQLINLGPFEGFKVAFQVALYGGIALASPFIFLFIGQFVLPALRMSEKKLLYQSVVMGAGLFVIGVLFAYFVIMQVVVLAAVQFSNWLGFGADQWRAADYIGTVCKLLLGMGLGFELPVIIIALVKLELLDYATMRKFRSYFIVINLVVSAFIMPPDGITMFLMAIPLQILFEISLMVARLIERKRKDPQA
jgi:sec-independent protein translocase protein TatC